MRELGYFVSTIVVLVIQAAFCGYAFSVLWGWFIVPTFGIASVNVPEAIGVILIVAFSTISHRNIDNEDSKTAEDKLKGLCARTVFIPPMFLLVGWIVTKFM